MIVSCDESSIAATYFESLRDDFESYARENDPNNPGSTRINPEKEQRLKDIREEFERLDPRSGAKPSLGQLFEIELDLTSLIPEMTLRTRYWAIENRFRRVVPKGVAQDFFARHTITDVMTHPEDGLRNLARSMLDTIHANYGVNFNREILIRRLMGIVAALAFVLIAITLTMAIAVLEVEAQRGLLMIAVIGMAGAIISTIQRLQKATARDAMIDDGIFELMSLRIGWASILMSIGIGGVSALFIYALVSAGLLDSVLPQIQSDTMDSGSSGGSAPPTSVVTCTPGKTCANWADAIYPSLGLNERSDLFKLCVFAFGAGFAERFVPDTINKLAKGVFKDPKSDAS